MSRATRYTQTARNAAKTIFMIAEQMMSSVGYGGFRRTDVFSNMPNICGATATYRCANDAARPVSREPPYPTTLYLMLHSKRSGSNPNAEIYLTSDNIYGSVWCIKTHASSLPYNALCNVSERTVWIISQRCDKCLLENINRSSMVY